MKTKNVRIETKDTTVLETLEDLKLLKNKINTIINEIGLQKILHWGNSDFHSAFHFMDLITRVIHICVQTEKLVCIYVQDHEDRLEKLEKQMEELKKRLPVDDGK
ncbi:hypothetical protein KGQ34_04645 [Patescibacteria group bacterium]|nr:hypothetical protein [Patescibacteria group bacterium]